MESGQGIGTRYRAFLSYNHKDRQQARWLHRRLESYRMPRRLAGRDGARGIVPARLSPIFRDREELPAAGDLSTEVRAALAASESLIVVCSPNAAASPWVAKEVRTFRELHPERPIFAAILEGEPAQCFPAGLSTAEIEPLAADLRPEGDGRRLGTLKLVAGIAGVGLDALVQRDAQRRIRRVTAVTLGALLMMLVTMGLAIFAFTQRVEAERQRAEAEGLVEFMLTDLRERLKGVGRLDVLTATNKRALALYEGKPLRSLSPDSLERRARILLAMGEDAEKLGDRSDALYRFHEAHRVTGEQLKRDPQNPERQMVHAQSAYWLGYIAYLDRNWDVAATYWGEYRRLAQQLAARDQDNADWLREEAFSEGNWCTLELAVKARPDAALRSCQRALVIMEKVQRLRPQELRTIRDVANRQAWLADAWLASGNRGRAQAAREAQLRLLEPYASRLRLDADLQDQWMRALMVMAEALAGEDRAKSRAYRHQAAKVARDLMRRDPSNEAWRSWKRRIEGTAIKDGD
ncbi:toll/interleukin-1 receptor domain-containing protein [Sphingosinicella sp. BN140058]|uniref:toll/interleukin-1 receptor domain-containing protein n=1 Tax=Sphingosinicella sp. BN140058 TaxID=1892855 RepID=UPI001011A091|nr:toll/interleukin-1 receptor domain-containing protein [Sphingosinicella sp. BN140058]QAY77380.1 toll/interleukin-1 receptor domain-containing protein [Sphingosinicella sp. BN140058]